MLPRLDSLRSWRNARAGPIRSPYSHGFATSVHGFATKTKALKREIPLSYAGYRLEWLGQLSLGYARKCSELGVNNLEQYVPSYTWQLRGKNFPSRWRFLGNSSTEISPVEGQQLQQKDNKRRESKNVIKRDASGKKSVLSCCKCLFGPYIGAKAASIHAKNVQNAENAFYAKNLQVSMG